MKKKIPLTERNQARIRNTTQFISKYHALNKELAKAQKNCNFKQVDSIKQQLDAMGGLEMYQKASLKGGDLKKGWGATGTWLVKNIRNELHATQIKVLDVGAISGQVYEKYKHLDVTSIDLNSQSPKVLRQDFMQRPIPNSQDSLFHVVCLSLVLNFVGDPVERGKMLIHSRHFLLEHGLLYIVLPLPCIQNSRYLNHDHFEKILESIGYQLTVFHFSKKLAYYLFKKNKESTTAAFPKRELNPGANRNNFAIVL